MILLRLNFCNLLIQLIMQMGTPMLEQDETSDRQVRLFTKRIIIFLKTLLSSLTKQTFV